MIRCLAVDDETRARPARRQYPAVTYLPLVKTARNAMEAIEILQNERIDLLF